jgi:hypothetical protein
MDFDVVFPTRNVKDITEFKRMFNASDHAVQLCSLKFEINKITGNKVIIKHDSHIKELLETINDLDKNRKSEGKTELYKSSLFCSLASVLRYMCINNIQYKFSENSELPDKDNVFKFKVGEHELQFSDTINITIMPNLWYIDNTQMPLKE